MIESCDDSLEIDDVIYCDPNELELVQDVSVVIEDDRDITNLQITLTGRDEPLRAFSLMTGIEMSCFMEVFFNAYIYISRCLPEGFQKCTKVYRNRL